jgi:hypothetical protein
MSSQARALSVATSADLGASVDASGAEVEASLPVDVASAGPASVCAGASVEGDWNSSMPAMTAQPAIVQALTAARAIFRARLLS